MNGDRPRSLIRKYVLDFHRHLRNAVQDREDFLVFYPLWREVRDKTIQNLEELLKRLETGEWICEVGVATGSALGIAGALTSLVKFATTGAFSPIATAVTCAAHGGKSGFYAAKAGIVSRGINQTSHLLQSDYEETQEFIRMGLAFDGMLQEIRNTVENLRQMTLSYTIEELCNELGLASIAMPEGTANPSRDVVQGILNGVEGVNNADQRNIRHILSSFNRNNPDVLRTFEAAAQAGFDLTGFSRLMTVSIIGDLGYEHLYGLGNLVNIGLDARDLARSYVNLCAGSSVTQDKVKSVLDRLKAETTWLENVYNRISRFSD